MRLFSFWGGVRSLAFVAAVGVSGCARGCSGLDELRSFPVGRVTGHVRLVADMPLPEYPEPLMAHEPLRHRVRPGDLPPECEAANRAARAPVELGADRGLSGIVVTASDFRRNRPRDPIAHRVRIEGCKLTPTTIAMAQGDRLVLENMDAFPFAPLYGPAYSAKPLLRGERLFVPVHAGSIEPLSCSTDAPCGRTDIATFHHPVNTVTQALGAFVLDGFPAAEPVRITALHPLFEPSETTVWVEPGETMRIELVLRPKARFLPVPH